jgi:hypothetical protein
MDGSGPLYIKDFIMRLNEELKQSELVIGHSFLS